MGQGEGRGPSSRATATREMEGTSTFFSYSAEQAMQLGAGARSFRGGRGGAGRGVFGAGLEAKTPELSKLPVPAAQ